MSKIPTGTAAMPLKSVYRQRLGPTIAAAVALTTAQFPSLHHLHSSSLVASFVGDSQSFARQAMVRQQQKVRGIRRIRNYSTSFPVHKKVLLPALSPTMETGTIVSWHKKEGDRLFEGDLVCEIETDKATMGLETPEEGYLAKILLTEGTKNVPVGKLLCIIVESAEDAKAFANFTADSDMPALGTIAPQPAEPSDVVKATPFAKQMADEKGVDLSGVTGSGPAGRVLASDLITGGPRMKSPGAAFVEGYLDLPLSSLRQTINSRAAQTKATIPHYHLTAEIVLDELDSLRQKLNSLINSKTDAAKLTIVDFVIKAAALACTRVPEANSYFLGDCIRENKNVDVSVAVSTENGFVAPVIHNAADKGIASIHDEVISFTTRAKTGQLQPHELKGGTFTVSMTHLDESQDFTTILNPGQSCNLAVGKTKKKLLPTDENDGYTTNAYFQCTLSCDHRVIDGAVGATWLRIFKQLLENPSTMLR